MTLRKTNEILKFELLTLRYFEPCEYLTFIIIVFYTRVSSFQVINKNSIYVYVTFTVLYKEPVLKCQKKLKKIKCRNDFTLT